MEIKPTQNYVFLAKPEDKPKERITDSGILISDDSGFTTETEQSAKVLAVGPDCKLQVGEEVLYSKFDFREIFFQGNYYLVGREDKITATL